MAVIILNKKTAPSKNKRILVKPIKDPKRIEYDARRTLVNLTSTVKDGITEIMNQMDINPDIDVQTIGKQLDDLRKQYELMFETAAQNTSREWVEKVNQINRKRTMDELRSALGIDVSTIISEEFQEDLDIMMYEAASYIKTIPSEMIFRVADRVLQHYKGIPMPENRTLRKQRKEEFKISDNRAKVIARDQTAKMNTSITAMRQRAIGIEMYVWETSRDERVVGKPGGLYKRISKLHRNHWMMQGKVCRWDDPTVYSDDKGKTWKKRVPEMPQNHPGQDIMCRCRPAPFVDIEQLRVQWAV